MAWLHEKGTYFRRRFRPSAEPPRESKNDASRVAGFLEARKAEIRRYFAEVDMWKCNSSESSQVPTFLLLPLGSLSLVLSAPKEDWLRTLNVSFRKRDIWGWRLLNNFLFRSSLGTIARSFRGLQYSTNNGEKMADNSSNLLVILQNGLSTTLSNKQMQKQVRLKKIVCRNWINNLEQEN